MRTLRHCLAWLALLAPGAALADLEHEVKAAFLFRFLSFVEWPAQSLGAPGAPLVVGVLGADEVEAALRTIVRGRSAQDRPVEVRHLRAGESAAGLQLLFVGRDAEAARSTIRAPAGTLLVCEWPGALAQGAMVNLLLVDGRVRFEVAPEAAERAGLRVSSRMLAVALNARPAP